MPAHRSCLDRGIQSSMPFRSAQGDARRFSGESGPFSILSPLLLFSSSPLLLSSSPPPSTSSSGSSSLSVFVSGFSTFATLSTARWLAFSGRFAQQRWERPRFHHQWSPSPHLLTVLGPSFSQLLAALGAALLPRQLITPSFPGLVVSCLGKVSTRNNFPSRGSNARTCGSRKDASVPDPRSSIHSRFLD